MTADIREEFEQLKEEMGEFCGAKKSEEKNSAGEGSDKNLVTR